MKRIRVILASYDHHILEKAILRIVNAVQTTGPVISVVALKTKKEIFTVLRGPHVNKDSREQFEQRIHRRLVDIYPPILPAPMLETLIKLELPMGVKAVIKS